MTGRPWCGRVERITFGCQCGERTASVFLRDQHAFPLEAAVHAVEIATAALEPLVFGQRFPHTMRVPARALGTESDQAVATLAHRERHGDVEVPVEAIALVESAD